MNEKCPYCQKEFKNKNSLKTHIGMIHKDKIKKMQCPICNAPVKNKLKTCGSKDCIKKLKLQKSIKTNLKKYGVENPLQSEEIKNKIKQTNLKKYGTEWAIGSKIIQNKVKQTNLKKYGVENVSNNVEIKQKISEINSKNKRIQIKNLIDYKLISKQYINRYYVYQWQCKKCFLIFNQVLSPKENYLPRCPKCFPNVQSKPEQELQNWIKSLNVKSESNKRFYENNIYKYELDCYLPEFNLGIEMDGIYWHSELRGKDKNYHINKTNYFKEKNIEVIHIWNLEWYDKQEIVKNIIRNKLKLNKSIYARKCIIKEVSIKEAKTFLDDNHLQGFNGAKIHLGLYLKDSLVAYMSLGKARFNKQYQWEMIRFANKININVVGGFSKLLKHFERNYKGSIISYVDLRYFNGNGYITNGFNLTKISKPNYFYTKNYKYLESRQQYQKHKLKDKLKSYNENLTEWENMKVNGYDRIWDCGNLVMIKNN